jgi:hypothetical protein
MPMPVITVTWGELFDRIAGLELDLERPGGEAARTALEAELESLRDVALAGAPGAVHAVASELKDLLRISRELEDRIGTCEGAGDYGPGYVALIRSIRDHAGRRRDLERSIDDLMRSGGAAHEGRED